MDLTKLSETELKALWFDQLAVIERSQANINAIKQEFSNRQKEGENPKPGSTPLKVNGVA